MPDEAEDPVAAGGEDLKLPCDIEFLSFEDLCEIHDRALAEFGEGMAGFIDEHAVRSAAAQAEAAVFGQYLHEFPAGMAAAYLFYLTRQQGFINGNKRTAVSAALEFLTRNGYRIRATTREVYLLPVDVASEDAPGDRHELLARVRHWIEARLSPMD